MKKVLIMFLVAGTTLTYSCNPKDDKSDKKENVSKNDNDGEEEENVETKATAELCTCINNTLEEMSPKAQKILIKAGDSDDPEETLKNEILKVSDDEEKQKIADEFQQFENNTQLQKCSDKVKKKYDLDDNNKKSQKRLLKAAEENEDCKLVYALMKIGMQQENKNTTRDQE